MLYTGQDFGEKGVGKVFRINQPLLLGFGHRNEALRRRRADPKTKDLDTVKGACEKGLQKARKWKSLTPQDVAEKIAEAGNANHGGAGNGWPQLLRMTRFKIDDAWFSFKRKLKVEDPDAAPEDANEEYELLWKFVKPRWGQYFSGKTQLEHVRTINRRLKSWDMWNVIMLDASECGDWTGTTMSTGKVISALLIVTQFFEKELAKSLPKEDFNMQLRTWVRFAYPNIAQPEDIIDSRHGLWWCEGSEAGAILAKVMACKMTRSVIYKHKDLKEQKAKGALDSEATKRSRGKKAEEEKHKKLTAVITPSESMTLQVVTSDGKTRDKYMIEDLVVSQKAAAKPSDIKDADKHCENIATSSLVMGNFALTIASNPTRTVFWRGHEYSAYSGIRRYNKLWLANMNNAVAMEESADTAKFTIEGMTQRMDEKCVPQWQQLLDRAETHVTISNCLKAYHGKPLGSTPFVNELAGVVAQKAGNLDSVLREIFDRVAAVVDDNCRKVAAGLAQVLASKGALPPGVNGLFTLQSQVKLLTSFRASVLMEVAFSRTSALVSAALAQELTSNFRDDAIAIDAMIEDFDMWARIWKWLFAPASKDSKDALAEELEQRVDNIKLMLNPTEHYATAMDQGGEEAGGECEETQEGKAKKSKKDKAMFNVPLLNHLAKFSVTVPADPTDGRPKHLILPMRIIDNFVAAANQALRIHMDKKTECDIGYSYCALRIPENSKLPDHVIGLKSNKSALKFNFVGEISYTPKVGAFTCVKAWGINFYIEPAKDMEHGNYYPSWLCKEGSTWECQAPPENPKSKPKGKAKTKANAKQNLETDINMEFKAHSIEFNFDYLYLGERKALDNINLKYWSLCMPPGSVRKWIPLKRGPFPEDAEVITSVGGASQTLKDLREAAAQMSAIPPQYSRQRWLCCIRYQSYSTASTPTPVLHVLYPTLLIYYLAIAVLQCKSCKSTQRKQQ